MDSDPADCALHLRRRDRGFMFCRSDDGTIDSELVGRSAHHGASIIMEPEHVDQTPSRDFPSLAARGDLRDGPSRVDHHRQELLAERSQAKRADRNWLSSRREFCIRLRPDNVISTADDRCQQRLFAVALSGRPEGSLMSA